MTQHTLPGQSPDASEDPQADAVYRWERECVEKQVGPQIMSRQQCEGMLRQAAGFLGMTQPEIEYGPLAHADCLAYPALHKMLIHTWGRSQVTLLHETAHLASWRMARRGEAGHGPTFVSVAMRLYERFLGIPMEYLERTAAERGIAFIPGMRPALAMHGRSADLLPDF